MTVVRSENQKVDRCVLHAIRTQRVPYIQDPFFTSTSLSEDAELGRESPNWSVCVSTAGAAGGIGSAHPAAATTEPTEQQQEFREHGP
jgi:hypothetical protein